MAEARLVPFRVEAGRGIMALDQTLLPHEERSIHLASVPELCEAIGSLRIRGAPMLGLAGLAGVAIAAETGVFQCNRAPAGALATGG
jgi:methylthioribose-1-phosphate isomerase